MVQHARRAAGVPADDLDAALFRLLDQWGGLDGIDAAQDDAVRLQRDRLAERGVLAGDGAVPVQDADLPADNFGGFGRAVPDAARTAVALVVQT